MLFESRSRRSVNLQTKPTVRDNGIGIPGVQLARIFLIFQRLRSRDKYPGTGIGLAIWKKIVESHRGRLWAESEFGKGSIFSFTLPTVIASTAERGETSPRIEADS